MPYLQVLSEFRHGVRKIAREKQGEAGGPVAVGVGPLCPRQPCPSLWPVLALAGGRWGLWGALAGPIASGLGSLGPGLQNMVSLTLVEEPSLVDLPPAWWWWP